jgi:hypothetical protein
MTSHSQARRLERLEAARQVKDARDLAGRLTRARKHPFKPTHTASELRAIGAYDDTAGRIARGWLRCGERFYLPDGSLPAREAPPIDPERALIDTIGALTHDPYRFALFALPWGEWGELASQSGPRQWQREALEDIGAVLAAGNLLGMGEAIQRAISSGHAAGKSAVVAMLVLWALSTHEDARVVVTANSAPQLTTKTWPELAKWHRLAINSAWFVCTATALYSSDTRHEKNWRADALPWSISRPEAFAGLHNQGKRILLVFDEASRIEDIIWETAEGALTDADTEMVWLACGNPTRATGRFHDALTKAAHRWHPRFIDTRHVAGVNKEQVQRYIDDYGIDSDYVRVRVRGLPPRASSLQFVSRELIDTAMARAVPNQRGYPAIVGVDVARFGSDKSVVRTRIGRDARTHPPIRLQGVDTMVLVSHVAQHVDFLRGAGYRVALFVDGGGVGGGVVDRLRQLGYDPIEVQFGGKADDSRRYANKRAEIYGRLIDWLNEGGVLPDDDELAEELANIEYGFTRTDQILLERKELMRARGLASPDDADALAVTFAAPVAIDIDEPARTPCLRRHDPYDPDILSRGYGPYLVIPPQYR